MRELPADRAANLLLHANKVLLVSICKQIPDSDRRWGRNWRDNYEAIREKSGNGSDLKSLIAQNEKIIDAMETDPRVAQAVQKAQVVGEFNPRQFCQDLLNSNCAEAERYAEETLPRILEMAQNSQKLLEGKS